MKLSRKLLRKIILEEIDLMIEKRRKKRKSKKSKKSGSKKSRRDLYPYYYGLGYGRLDNDDDDATFDLGDVGDFGGDGGGGE
jgi:hypothetical protein